MNGDSTVNQDVATPDIQERSRVSNIAIGFLLVVAAFLAYNFFRTDTANVPTGENNNSNVAVNNPTATITGELSDFIDEETGLDAPGLVDEELSQNEYLVQAGDTLWKIAENKLNDGFRWTEIAALNNISASDGLAVGTILTLPEAQATDTEDTDNDLAAEGPTETEQDDVLGENDAATDVDETPETAAGDEEEVVTTSGEDQFYTVQRGDTLWSIAQQFYGDGNLWTKIFENGANHISMYTSQDGVTYPIIHSGNILVIPAIE